MSPQMRIKALSSMAPRRSSKSERPGIVVEVNGIVLDREPQQLVDYVSFA